MLFPPGPEQPTASGILRLAPGAHQVKRRGCRASARKRGGDQRKSNRPNFIRNRPGLRGSGDASSRRSFVPFWLEVP
jgi:hypothetical protein